MDPIGNVGEKRNWIHYSISFSRWAKIPGSAVRTESLRRVAYNFEALPGNARDVYGFLCWPIESGAPWPDYAGAAGVATIKQRLRSGGDEIRIFVYDLCGERKRGKGELDSPKGQPCFRPVQSWRVARNINVTDWA